MREEAIAVRLSGPEYRVSFIQESRTADNSSIQADRADLAELETFAVTG
jgi:hypothetical protein